MATDKDTLDRLTPDAQTIDKIVDDLMSGRSHFQAWCAVADALDRADPNWLIDRSKSPVENAVAWIESKAAK